jgi:hypothetical protein
MTDNKVSPAGDVEVHLANVVGIGQTHVVLVKDYRANVNRLAQELERSQAGGQLLVRDRDDLQAQLTQALECVSAIGRLAFSNDATIYSAAPSFIIDIRNALYAYAYTPEPTEKSICPRCSGEGRTYTGIEESPSTLCDKCNGHGVV